MKLRITLAALLFGATLASSATAQQPWISDRRYGEGIGIRSGNLEFHPSVSGEFGYDSNYFQRGERDGSDADPAPVVDALRFRLTPSLTLGTLGERRRTQSGGGPGAPPAVKFEAGAHATYNEFLPLDSGDDFDNRSRLSGGANLLFELFPRGKFGWDISGNYQRAIDPSWLPTGDSDFDRHALTGTTGVSWRPGGGLFEWRLGYEAHATFFTEGDFDTLNNLQHTIDTRGRWRFLPRTALLYDGEYKMVRFSDLGDAINQNDGDIVQSRLGISGLVTNHFAFRVMGGWAASFYEDTPTAVAYNFDGWVGNAEVRWYITPNPALQPGSAAVGISSLAAGYQRSYSNSYLGTYYQRDKGYLKLEYFLGGVAVVTAEGRVARHAYPTVDVAGRTLSDISETLLGGTLFGEYRVTEIVGINATVRYDQNLAGGTNPIQTDPMDPSQSQEDLEYARFQAFIGARVFW